MSAALDAPPFMSDLRGISRVGKLNFQAETGRSMISRAFASARYNVPIPREQG
jgi:hypothetical protein